MTKGNKVSTLEKPSFLDDILNRLVAKQKEELKREQFKPESFDDLRNMFLEFKATNKFKQIYEEARRYHLVPHTDGELEESKNRFAGRSYQDLAYKSIADKEFPTRIVLSPKRTHEFYKGLYPDAKDVEHSFELDSLERISVPDGILIEEYGGKQRIVAVCEYTLKKEGQYFENKYNGFNKGREKFKKYFNNANLIFVIPKETFMSSIDEDGVKGKDEVEFRQMSFGREDFGKFIDAVYKYSCVEKEDIASLVEMQERAREQLQRGMNYTAQGEELTNAQGKGLTPEYENYMKRLGELGQKFRGPPAK